MSDASAPIIPPADAATSAQGDPRADFGRIAFEGLRNTRDLGGLPTVDGRRVRRRALLRSGMLDEATEADRARLRDEYRLALDVDLRGNVEVSERPDPVDAFPGVRFVHLPVFSEGAAGVSRSAEDMEEVAARMQRGEIEPVDLMTALYPHIVLDQAGITAYRAFFEEVLAAASGAAGERGAILWHCSAGKDRCGMASVLMEVALGVPWNLVHDDYMATNLILGIDPATCEPMEALEGVNERFLSAAMDALNREYGGILPYMERELGVGGEERAALRAHFLCA